MIGILYRDDRLVVCIKPAGVLSTDEEGGLPGLLKDQLGLEHAPRTVHRLDQVVSGVMVLAIGAKSASLLSEQVMSRSFGKEYLAVVRGRPAERQGTLTDLLGRDKARRMTYVADAPAKGVQEAILDYEVLAHKGGLSLVRIALRTGRTHQIRVQFASRGMPLVGERKYAQPDGTEPIALWSHRVAFRHPFTGEKMAFSALPPEIIPWDPFTESLNNL